MKNIAFKSLLPYLIAIPIILVVAAIYFRPEVFEGKVLQQSDVMQFEGMSKMSQEYGKKYGQPPLWNVAMFSGFPEYLIASVPDGVLHYLFRLTTGFLEIGSSMQLFFVLAACAWGMMLCFRINPYLAIVGGILTALSTFYIISLEVGHVTKLWAIAYASMVIGGLHLFYTGKKWLGLALFALFLALQLRANHYQITFYLFFVCLIYVANELVWAYREKKLVFFLKQTSLLAVAILLAVLTQLGRLWMTYEYTPYSIRGKSELTPLNGEKVSEGLDKEYAFSWSQGKLETFTLLIPYFYGGSSHEKLREDSHSFQAFAQVMGKEELMRYIKNDGISLPLYYGDQPFTAGPLYAGAVVCFLFVLALFLLDDRQRWWILAAAVLCMMFAWGRNLAWFNFFLFDYVPGFNKFRSVSMALSMTLLLMPLGAMLALQNCLHRTWEKTFQRKFLWALALTGGMSLLMWLLSHTFDYQHPNDASTIASMFGSQEKALISLFKNAFEDDRKMLLQKDALRSSAFIVAVAALLWAMLTQKWKTHYVLTAIAFLAILDLWVVDKRYLNKASFIKKTEKSTFTPSAADKEILKDTTLHYRVMNLQNTFQEARTSYFHKSIGGYFAAKMRRYQDLIERQLLPEQQRLIANIQTKKEDIADNLPALCMLNTKYFKLGEGKQDVLLNPSALGNAWFVDSLKLVSTPDEEIASLNAIHPKRTAILNQQKFSAKATSFQKDTSAWVKLLEFQPRKLVYEYKNNFDGFLVFSEVYYPHGWKAFLDGQEVPILNVNYVLRGLETPSGKHQIVFTFNPVSFEVGSKISTYASWILLSFLIAAIFLEWKQLKTS